MLNIMALIRKWDKTTQLYLLLKYSIATKKFIPLVTDPLYLACMAKISILKEEGTIEKIPMSVKPMSR